MVLDHVRLPWNYSRHHENHRQLHPRTRAPRKTSAVSEHHDDLLHGSVSAFPLLGAIIDYIPWQVPFLAVSGTIACSGLLTYRMAEPRYDLASGEAGSS